MSDDCDDFGDYVDDYVHVDVDYLKDGDNFDIDDDDDDDEDGDGEDVDEDDVGDNFDDVLCL